MASKTYGTPRQRLMTTAVLAVGGGAISVATWVGGQHGLAVAVGVFYLICMLGAYVWAGREGDIAAIMRVAGDERQRALDHRATAWSGLAMGAFCIGGCVIDLAHGGSGNPWGAGLRGGRHHVRRSTGRLAAQLIAAGGTSPAALA